MELQSKRLPVTSERRSEIVFLGVPTYDYRVDIGTANAVNKAARQVRCVVQFNNASLLAHNFNCLLANALNLRADLGVTHFLLLHADVVPQDDDWLIKLLDIQVAADLDALSAVIPIKDRRGLTSTGLDYSGLPDVQPWAVRRLTMTEVLELPETFTAVQASSGISDYPLGLPPVLMFNTGLLLFDLRRPWVENVCFTINDQLRRGADGRYEVFCEPEDWGFSRQVNRLGVRVAATRAVRIEHPGRIAYLNCEAWGERTDPAFRAEEVPD